MHLGVVLGRRQAFNDIDIAEIRLTPVDNFCKDLLHVAFHTPGSCFRVSLRNRTARIFAVGACQRSVVLEVDQIGNISGITRLALAEPNANQSVACLRGFIAAAAGKSADRRRRNCCRNDC